MIFYFIFQLFGHTCWFLQVFVVLRIFHIDNHGICQQGQFYLFLFILYAFLFCNFRFLFIYFQGEGREGERKGEKHQCVVASCVPPSGDLAHNPGMCPYWESNQRPFGWQASTQSTELHQPGLKTCLGCGPGPQYGACVRQPNIYVSLPLFLLPSPLS